ncbi:MAG TPA: low temperature requirement protein A [Solirubrobacteraceae bacterium]|nr:low temperature requirement protein A [Solirubrobacteraceae bacterium]
MSSTAGTGLRLGAVLRQEERVTSLELFFDLVFVLALTQCTALVARDPVWANVGRAALILGVLWWSWTGYSWLTSVLNPEEGSVRLVMFAAMGALLVAALCVPGAFGSEALLFAIAYGFVRAAHIALFMLASRGDVKLRRSVVDLAASSAIAVAILVAAAFVGPGLRVALWVLALAVDLGGPYLFGAEGWRIAPAHFAERHGAIVIIALGESIVAIGAGASHRVTAGVVAAALLGAVIAAALWWLYFDIVSIVAERRLIKARPGRERNEMARDVYSYMHFPMVAGIAFVAVGLKRALPHSSQPLGHVAATAMIGGAALYLAAHVALRWRTIRSLNRQRLACIAILGVLLGVDFAVTPAALVTIGALAALLSGLIAYEALRFSERRDRIRHLEPLET